jgi:hypothetical protein
VDAIPSNTNLVASATVTGVGSNFTLNITLVPYKTGTSTITLAAGDQFGIGTGTMTLTVTPVEYAPVFGPIADTNTPANTPVNVVLNVSDVATSISNLTYSATVSDSNVIRAVTFSFNGSNEVATLVPATNRAGAAAVTITVSDGVTNVSQTFAVTVTAPTPPTLAAITNQSTLENTPVQVVLSVTSPSTSVSNLTFSGSSTNTNLVKSITFSFNGTNEVAVITPVTNATGVANVTISVSDGFSTNSQSFTLAINSPVPPTLSATEVNGVLRITFTGTPGATYNIESSTDLVTWTTITTVTANPTTGAVEYDATVGRASGGTFFKAELQ